jgi:signal transduction histidine kinase
MPPGTIVPTATVAESVAQRAERLLQVTTALLEATTTADVANVTLGIGLGVVEATRGFICCLDRSSGMRMLHASGYDNTVLERVIALRITDDTPLTRCLRTGRPVYLCSVDEYRETYPWAYGQFGAVSDTQAHAALPLIHSDSIIGGLGLSFATSTDFGAADRTFTLLLAQATAGALARAMNFDAERECRREAELLARARQEVLAVVAHDLRNPINLINGTAELLIDLDPPTDKRRELLAISKRAVRQMNRLVTDLLDANRLETGELAIDVQDCSATEIVDEVATMMRPAAARNRLTLTVGPPSGCPSLRADPARIVQALGNLVANAIKFTPAGGHVELAALPKRRTVAFTVADNGPGIPESARRHLFEKFWQVNRDRRGLGLGLAIVKGIADAHGARMVVRSEVGRGTTFAIVCPRDARVVE